MVCKQFRHGSFEGFVMLDTRILLVGVGYGILISLVRSNLCRKVFSKDSLDFVTVLPFYVPPPVVEFSDDV